MDYRIRDELNRMTRTAEMNARAIADMSIEIKRLCSEIQVVKRDLELLQGPPSEEPIHNADSCMDG